MRLVSIIFSVFTCLFMVSIVHAEDDFFIKDALPESLMSRDLQDTKIVANIPARKITVIHEGRKIYEFPVAVGAPSFKTPIGQLYLKNVVWNPWWMPPKSDWAKDEKPTPPGPSNPLGPVKMEMDGTLRFHGTSNEKSIGTAASHGCIRLYNEDAKTLAWWIQQNFSDKGDPALYEKYAANRTTPYHVNLHSPIRVHFVYDSFEIKGPNLIAHPDIYGKVDREKVAYQFLVANGFSLDRVNGGELTELLEASKKVSMALPLKDIISNNDTHETVSAQVSVLE